MPTCILCKNEAVESKTLYTVYVRERSDVPFRDEQKKEYLFCSKHSETSLQFAMMVDRGKPSGKLPPVRFSDINEKQIVKVFSENRYEQIRPMVYRYRNVFTEEEIEQALSTNYVSTTDIKDTQDSAKREQKKSALLLPLASVLVGALLLTFGIVFSQWLFIVAGILGLVVAPLVIVMSFVINSVVLNRKPGLKTPQALAENFYDDVSQLISFPDDVTRKVTAYRLLAHTTVKRAEANSVERLGTAWNDLWHMMKDAMTKKHQNQDLLKSDGVRYSTSMPPHKVVISPKNERVAQVDCEIWFFIGNEKKELGWAILRFDNLAIKNGDRWFLMAGEPGKLQAAD